MTVRHLFLWSVTDGDRGQEVLDQLATLDAVVPGIQNWSIGANTFTSLPDSRARHFEYALTCDFDTLEELQAYQEHPAHQEIVERVFPLYGDWAVVDLELPN
jgi:antibiotic biosynthesis monooxygenase (ABM) superfamily enzyme